MVNKNYSFWSGILVSTILATVLVFCVQKQSAADTAVTPQANDFGYGFNMAEWDTNRLQDMGFNWMKVFDAPGSKQPVNVMLRFDANASHMSNVNGFANNIENVAKNSGAYIDAYEIGNEVNLDATYGWGHGSTNVPPNADDYAELLCSVYPKIKAADPTAIVISAGLAPTGRVSGTWNGHLGHNGLYQDEREYLAELVTAINNRGGNCVDAIGYHPYGYSADFDTAPDTDPAHPDAGIPTKNCTNGFCFRGVESFYSRMQAEGMGDKQVWVTEFGWITRPPDECLSQGGWSGREWQIVSEQKQADNLVGAFQYAAANYPWMGGMVIFNLNFNVAPWITDPCEQMRYYAVQGRPAEAALANMPKEVQVPTGELTVNGKAWGEVIAVADQPFSGSGSFTLTNKGTAAFNYSLSVDNSAPLQLSIQSPTSGSLDPAESITINVDVESVVQPVGHFSNIMEITAVGNNLDVTQQIPFDLYILSQVNEVFLPAVDE